MPDLRQPLPFIQLWPVQLHCCRAVSSLANKGYGTIPGLQSRQVELRPLDISAIEKL